MASSALAPARVFFAVESDLEDLPGLAIRTFTELFCTPPWVMGPDRPATHAYVCWEHADGLRYRLDAAPPVATISQWDGIVPGQPMAYWEVLQPAHRARVWTRAMSLDGTPYDLMEAVGQGLPGLARLDFARRAAICTNLTLRCLEGLGPVGVDVIAAMETRYPELLAQRLEKAADGHLLSHVILTG